jgi:ribosomal protein L37AE/L43A
MARFMLRIASHLPHGIMDRHCPSCGRAEVRRSARKNFFEAALLPIFLTRPFRCENCGNRFFGLAFRRRIPAPDYATPMADVPQGLPVLVYGRGKDEEPFREETNLHLLNLRGGLITLATSVEPGQRLILMNVASEEDQRCRVAFVGEQHLGRSMVGIQFNWLTQRFSHIDDPVCQDFCSSVPGTFWEQ